MDKITKRQEDVLLNIFLSDQAYDGERTREPYASWEKRHGDPVPEWGRPAPNQRWSRAGGATHRMMERLMDEGLIPHRWSPRGYRHMITSRLTVKAARHLFARYPALPGIAGTVEDLATVEAEAEAEKAKARAEQKAAMLERAARRAENRRERMAAVLRDFQVLHDLAAEQLEAMWLRIVEEESLL